MHTITVIITNSNVIMKNGSKLVTHENLNELLQLWKFSMPRKNFRPVRCRKSKLVPDVDLGIARHRGRTHEISQAKLLNVNRSRWESFAPD